MKTKYFLILCTYLCCVEEVTAQTQNLYCIRVQHLFSSWGDCWNDKPTFSGANITISGGQGAGENANGTITSIGQSKDFLFQRPILSGPPLPTRITINAYAGNIVNDTHLQYDFTGDDLLSGVHSKRADASDPCNNYMSISREGYTQSTTVTVDDPMELANVSKDAQGGTKSTFKTEGESLTLQVGEAYWAWGTSKARLEVA